MTPSQAVPDAAAPTAASDTRSAPAAGPARRPATLDDVRRCGDVKAELIDGRVVEFPMPGRKPSRVAFKVACALEAHVQAARLPGEACADGRDFAVGPLRSRRRSFRPDASYHVGRMPNDANDVIPGPPTFAVEVRSREDHGPSAEDVLAQKRSEYFEAGTIAVWDVDPDARTVGLHRRSDPDHPVVFRAGETAHAEPAVPGWTMRVDEVFA